MTPGVGAGAGAEGEVEGKIEGFRLPEGLLELTSALGVRGVFGETIKVAGLKICEQEIKKGRKTSGLKRF